MKEELSALEIRCIVNELQKLVGSKIDRIFQPKKEEILLQLYSAEHGKNIVRIVQGKWIYLTQYKSTSPASPLGYCTYLRKHLNQARLRKIEQVGFERIVEFLFETKERELKLLIELFGKGNIILCDKDNVILSPLETQIWKDRAVKKGEKYTYPMLKHSTPEITNEQFNDLINKNKKEVVKTIAVELGLGGVFAEEVCINAGIDKKKTELSKVELERLWKSIDNLTKKQIDAVVVYINSNVKNILPFSLELYKGLESESFGSFNEALDAKITQKIVTEENEEKSKVKNKGLNKVQKIIDMQTLQLNSMKKSADENQKKAEMLYENYQDITNLLNEIKNLRKTHSWEETKEILKKYKFIKKVNEKEGKITIEYGE